MILGDRHAIERAKHEALGHFATDETRRRARDWARGVLEEEGIEPRSQGLRALRAVRGRRPALSLAAARHLVALAAARD